MPGHEGAMTSLLSVVADRPRVVPPEAEQELARFQEQCEAEAQHGMLVAYMGWLLFAPILLWIGARSYAAGGIALLPLACAGFLAWLMHRGAHRPPVPSPGAAGPRPAAGR